MFLYLCLIIMAVGMRAVQFGVLLNLEEEEYSKSEKILGQLEGEEFKECEDER